MLCKKEQVEDLALSVCAVHMSYNQVVSDE